MLKKILYNLHWILFSIIIIFLIFILMRVSIKTTFSFYWPSFFYILFLTITLFIIYKNEVFKNSFFYIIYLLIFSLAINTLYIFINQDFKNKLIENLNVEKYILIKEYIFIKNWFKNDQSNEFEEMVKFIN